MSNASTKSKVSEEMGIMSKRRKVGENVEMAVGCKMEEQKEEERGWGIQRR